MTLQATLSTTGIGSSPPWFVRPSPSLPVHAVTFFHLTPGILALSSTTAMLLDLVAAMPATSRTDSGQIQEQALMAEIRLQQDAALKELRGLSGLTWDQVASLFKVSLRAVHHWVSGKPMTAKNSEHLQRVLSCLRRVDRGSQQANNTAIKMPVADGRLAIDLLAAHKYEEFLSELGHAVDGVRTNLLQPIVRPDRLPEPIDALMAGTIETPAHISQGIRRPPTRIVRAVRGS